MKTRVCMNIRCRVVIFQVEPEGDKTCPGCGKLGGQHLSPVVPS